ncbi:hypothetical protein ABIA30_003750 [Mycobacterium sp. MAA66]
MAPVAAVGPQAGRSGRPSGPRTPAGYRWIAVRPGAAPATRRPQQPLGPTPHYNQTPRWGLDQEFEQIVAEPEEVRTGPSQTMVQTATVVAIGALAAAALIHVVRYVLLLINRTILLNPWVAGAGTWLGVAASVIAAFAVVTVAVVLTNWLVARRAEAYERVGATEPRQRWWLRLASLVPVLNLFWAPVFVIELATVENRLRRLRRSIVTWWAVWVVATLLAVWSVATSFTSDPQGIADNTVSTTVAYLAGLAALVLVHKVYSGFEGAEVGLPGQRWVITDPGTPSESAPDSVVPVEQDDEEPAA